MLDKDPKLEAAVISNSNGWKISTHVDLYHTLIDLLTYPSHYHPKPFKATRKRNHRGESIMVTPISLLRQRYLVHRSARRSCLSAGVAFEFCACIQWKGTSRKMEGLAEYALSQVNKDMWLRNKASFSGCQPLRLSTIVSAYEMQANIQRYARHRIQRSWKPGRQRYRFKVTTRAGEGFTQESFVFEVQHIKWKFNIIHHPKFNELDMAADGLRLIKKYRLSPTHGYEKCLGPMIGPRIWRFVYAMLGGETVHLTCLVTSRIAIALA